MRRRVAGLERRGPFGSRRCRCRCDGEHGPGTAMGSFAMATTVVGVDGRSRRRGCASRPCVPSMPGATPTSSPPGFGLPEDLSSMRFARELWKLARARRVCWASPGLGQPVSASPTRRARFWSFADGIPTERACSASSLVAKGSSVRVWASVSILAHVFCRSRRADQRESRMGADLARA